MPTETRSEVLVEVADVDDLRRQGEDLMRAHAREMEPALADRFDPDWQAYYMLEEQGELITIGAWVQKTDPVLEETCWSLVGYAVAFLMTSLHYDLVTCHHDLLYIDRTYRKGRVGLRIIRAVVEQAQRRGAARILMHAKPGSTLMKILPRIGFQEEETVFFMELE